MQAIEQRVCHSPSLTPAAVEPSNTWLYWDPKAELYCQWKKSQSPLLDRWGNRTSPTSTLFLLKDSLPLYKSELRILWHVQCEHLFVWEYVSLIDKRLCVWHCPGYFVFMYFFFVHCRQTAILNIQVHHTNTFLVFLGQSFIFLPLFITQTFCLLWNTTRLKSCF